MAVQRIMGIETEYGVLAKGNPWANPMLMSAQVVQAYKEILVSGNQIRWDYKYEDPLLDARGFRIQRAAAHPSQLTDDPKLFAPSGDEPKVKNLEFLTVERPVNQGYEDPGASNVISPNGARFYVDHAHPEYSSPEVLNPLDVVTWDEAGDLIALNAARYVQRKENYELRLYKNNTDGKGASYGSHENYLVARDVPFQDIIKVLMPFFVTRNIFCGSGRVGLNQDSSDAGFQISQRADFIEAEVGLETTLRRPIINTRDEPHSDSARWRRLHVIVGDANRFQVSTYLKFGVTSLMLWALENRDNIPNFEQFFSGLELKDPVNDFRLVSRDLSLQEKLFLTNGNALSALDIQFEYLAFIQAALLKNDVSDATTWAVVNKWEQVLKGLAAGPLEYCYRTVEWVAKLRILQGLKTKHGLDWSAAKLKMLDLQWADIDPAVSIFSRLLDKGEVERLVEAEAVSQATKLPPKETRAYFRGRSIDKFFNNIAFASWDAVVFDVPGDESLRKLSIPNPYSANAQEVAQHLEKAKDVKEFLTLLGEVDGGYS